MAAPMGEGIIERDLKRIIDAKGKNTDGVTTQYFVVIHTVDIDEHVALLESIEVHRDYIANISEYIVVNFKMQMGDFIHDVFKHRDNLELTIVKKTDKQQVSFRYKFVMLNNKNLVHGSHYEKMSREDLNQAELANIEGQCLNLYTELLRPIEMDGMFMYTSPEDLLITQLDDTIKTVRIGGTGLDVCIDCVSPDNKRVYQRLNVPTGIKILELPSFIQNTDYGVYNGGIGTFFQTFGKDYKETVFIYPLYDYKRFLTEDKKKLVIYKATTNRLDLLESTYMVDGDILNIIAGSNTNSSNIGEDELMNSGGEIVATNPNVLIERNAIVTDEDVKVANSANLRGQKIKDHADGGANVNYVGNTDNLYKHRTEIMKKMFTLNQVQWNFSNADLIYPGMPVMYVYENKNNEIERAYGTVISTYTRYVKPAKSLNTLINILVINEKEIPKN